MSGALPLPIAALVTHARRVPAVERERFATALRRESAGRALILETCHRVEAYLGSADEAARLAGALPAGGRALTGEHAVQHAMKVAVGRDSVVVGEDQILHQLRASVDAARSAGILDPALERLFALALQAGRRARSWRQGPARSLADIALASIERLAGPIQGHHVLVVGAGRMGRLATRAAVVAGASVAVANRSADGAVALAASAGARVEAFDPDVRIGSFAAIVVALAGPWPIGPATIETLAGSATVVVDLSVPSAVPVDLAEILGSRLITADALALVESEPQIPEDGSAARLEALIDRATAEFVAWMKVGDGRAAAEALVERVDRERAAELAMLWRRLPDLEPDESDAIEGMTRHLADRLLREPLERLGRDADGREGRTIRDIFAL
jgi:glutamyl-tRNA reductase